MARLLAAGLLCQLLGAAAEVKRVKDQPVPPAFTFEVARLLYVETGSEVTVSDIQLKGHDGAAAGEVHMGLIPWGKVEAYLDPQQFCKADGGLKFVQTQDVYEWQVLADPMSTLNLGPLEGKVYGVFFANCGRTAGGTMTSTITVTNKAGGLIPSIDRPHLYVSGLFTVLLMLIGGYWGYQLMSQPEVLEIHKSLGMLALTALCDCALSSLHYLVLDSTGEESFLAVASVACAVTKVSICFQVLFLSANVVLGDDGSSEAWRGFVAALGAMALIPRLCVSTDRHEYLIQGGTLIISSGVGAVGVAVALLFAVRDLSRSMTAARESRREVALKCLQQTCVVMFALIGIHVLLALLAHFDHPEKQLETGWSYGAHFVALPHQAAFLLSIAYLMHVWSPSLPLGVEKISEADVEETADLVGGGAPSAETVGASAPAE